MTQKLKQKIELLNWQQETKTMSSSPYASMSRMEQQMEKQLAAALEKLTAKSEVIIHRYVGYLVMIRFTWCSDSASIPLVRTIIFLILSGSYSGS